MHDSRHIIVFSMLLYVFLISACEGFTRWDRPDKAEEQLVVEAILTDEFRYQEINLSQVYQQLNGEAPQITDAMVIVETNLTSYEFHPDLAQPGTYISDTPFKIVDHLTYNLIIEWEGITYQASSQLSSVAPMPEITFRQLGNSENYTFVEFAPIISTSQQAMYEVEVDWSHITADSTDKLLTYFHTFNSIHVNGLIRPRKEAIAFPLGSNVLVRKYGLDDSFADFLMAMVIETEWDGNLYFANSENLPSNISNGALGYFSTCSVVVDTLTVE